MKVLRTALLSTLLIICFGHIGHAQLLLDGGTRNNCDQAIVGVSSGSMTYLDGRLRVAYAATVSNNCGNAIGYTEVVWNGVVVYSQTFENGTLPVNITVDVPLDGIKGQEVNVECTACEGNNCYREGGAVAYTGG